MHDTALMGACSRHVRNLIMLLDSSDLKIGSKTVNYLRGYQKLKNLDIMDQWKFGRGFRLYLVSHGEAKDVQSVH